MKSKKLNEGFQYIDDKYLDIVEEEKTTMGQKKVWIKWGAIAASFAIIATLAYVNLEFLIPKGVDLGDVQLGDTINDQEEKIGKNQSNELNEPNNLYVDASDLITSSGGKEELLVTKSVEIPNGKYKATYSKVNTISSEKLQESKGKKLEGLDNIFYLSGHNDLQYIIQKSADGIYELLKFQSFESENYPYGDVLELVYGINSAEDIVSIYVEAANMDNTDSGKKAQEEIGTLTVTKKEDIREIYEIISAMICYGEDNWDMIDYGSNDSGMVESVRQGRYLTFNLRNKSAIDGLKYTGISGMFYEYSGIAYNRLNDADKGTVERIIGIK